MNSLIIFPEELISDTRVIVRGERANYLIERHVVSEGCQRVGGLWNGNRGTLRCINVTPEEIEWEVDFKVPPLERSKAALIVAVPRPQTVKKVIQAAASFGTTELHFVRTRNVVPSYLSSKTLSNEAIKLEVLKALEQTCDTIPPAIKLHSSWPEFVSESLASLSLKYESCWTAHTRSTTSAPTHGSSLIAAIGPETGWTDEELKDLARNNFIECSLGARILRVEHAVIRMLSYIS